MAAFPADIIPNAPLLCQQTGQKAPMQHAEQHRHSLVF